MKQWRIEPVPMPGEPGKFEMSEIVKWYVNRTKSPTSLSGEAIKAVDIRLKTAQAEAKELENSLTKGNLVRVDDVDRWAATIMIELRESFLQLIEMRSTSVPPECRDEVRTESERHIRAILEAAERKLSEHDYVIPDEEAEGTEESK